VPSAVSIGLADQIGDRVDDHIRIGVAQQAVPGRGGVEAVGHGDQVEPHAGRGLEGGAHAQRVVVVDAVGAPAAVAIGDLAIAALAVRGDAQAGAAVGAGRVPAGGDGARIVLGQGGLGVAFLVAGRLAGFDVDRAAQRVAAIQRALRPLQHLDAFEVEQRHLQLLLVILRHAVDHDSDRRIGVVHLRHAADGQERVAVRVRLVEGQVRREVGHFLRTADAGLLDAGGRKHGDRHRHVLHPLRPVLGGDDHRVEALVQRRLGPGRAQRGAERQRQRQRRRPAPLAPWSSTLCHALLPLK